MLVILYKLYQFENISISSVLRVFIISGYWILYNALPASNEINHVSLSFINMVICID